MSATEEALVWRCRQDRLVGIVSHPAVQPRDLGVVIIVGGPQYRAGSHRQFVLLARALADNGFPVLRFDYRGMGDSEGDLRNFEQVGADIGTAIDGLCGAAPAVQRVVLWGLCDGASAALLYLHEQADPRVAGLALLNPWLRSATSLAKTHVKHYYGQRLLQAAFWRKLLSGRVGFGAFGGLLRNLRQAFGATGRAASPQATPYQDRMARAWADFAGRTLLLLSEKDLTAHEFSEFSANSRPWQNALAARPPTRVVLADADHTCSRAQDQQALAQATLRWLTAGA